MYSNVVITGSGRFIPDQQIDEAYFANHDFYHADQSPVNETGKESAKKLTAITGIKERRYASKQLVTSDMAAEAARIAIADSGIDSEQIDQIIVAQNFGDVQDGSTQGEFVPSVASKVKHALQINAPQCVAYDIVFGCPGWIQGVIQATAYMKAGLATTCLIIGAETLSRVTDPHDRDSMIYADGAGAVVLQCKEEEQQRGLLSMASQSHTKEEALYLYTGPTNHPTNQDDNLYIKMHGRKIYHFALNEVPKAMKYVLDQSGKNIDELTTILIHQANQKMDEAIVERFYSLYGQEAPTGIMPMSIDCLGNSSVATIPTLYDLIVKGDFENQTIQSGDVLLFASVGAGMNINAFVYSV